MTGAVLLRGGALADAAAGQRGAPSAEAVGAEGGVGADRLGVVVHAGAEGHEVRAQGEVGWGGLGLERGAVADEGGELAVGVVGQSVGKEIGVEARADGLVEVEGQDGLTGAIVAQVPDGATAALVEGRRGDDEGLEASTGGGAEAGAVHDKVAGTSTGPRGARPRRR